MDKFGKSQPAKRIEDVRLLTGQGRYVDDDVPAGALFAWFLRSPVAHAEITELDLEDARDAPGVLAVFDAAALEALGVGLELPASLVTNQDGSSGAAPARPALARSRVRFVGEPVAVVIAETLDQARDAGELIGFDYGELPVNVTAEPGGPLIHDEAPDNLAFDWGRGDRDATEAAFQAAAHRVRLEVADNRIIVASLEPRGCTADWDGARLHFAVNGQGVWPTKALLAKALGLKAEAVHVTTSDVGGGFGMKGMDYPEHIVVAAAARHLGRPVRWMSDRGEAMLCDNSGRDLISACELAFDADLRITAYRVDTTCNLGAYNSKFAQAIQSELFSKVLTGCYDVQTTWHQARGYYTNTTQVDAYRGAGRPEAIYAMERVIDQAAHELGVDAWELRRRNFIRAGQFPYLTATGETYDVGDFHRLLGQAEDRADRAGFAVRRKASEENGRLRGLGLCYYIESILGDPSEGVEVTFNDDGTVSIHVGTQSNGQGHETVYVNFLSDQTGIPADRIRVVQGDSDLIHTGGGTGGSRSVTVQANATLKVVEVMVTAFTPYVADMLGVDAAAVRWDGDCFRAEGSNQSPSLIDVADAARAEGRDDLLRHAARATLPGRSYPNGAHVAEVEIDPDTGNVTLERYTVVDDFGNLINPMLAEGQVHGGVAQGVGQALCERVVHDEDAQLLTASFMDYALPRADILPMIGFDTAPVPSTTNPMGMKGCGEAGTVGALAAVSNAVADALRTQGLAGPFDMPFTPERVWAMLSRGQEI